MWQVPPGFEPGMRGSKPQVLTATLWNQMRQPVIETGAIRWKRTMLPLHHCRGNYKILENCDATSGVRTHA